MSYRFLLKKVLYTECRTNKGFALVELMVSISIIIIISGVVLYNFPSFSSRVVLDNLAHEIALTIREAQVYGIGVKERVRASGDFPGYGVYFDLSNQTGNDKQFIFFTDINSSSFYESGEELDIFELKKGNFIKEMCRGTGGGGCSPVNDSLHITYRRPDPEAKIKTTGAPEHSHAKITIESSGGDNKVITVWANGQIAVE